MLKLQVQIFLDNQVTGVCLQICCLCYTAWISYFVKCLFLPERYQNYRVFYLVSLTFMVWLKYHFIIHSKSHLSCCFYQELYNVKDMLFAFPFLFNEAQKYKSEKCQMFCYKLYPLDADTDSTYKKMS